MTTSSRRWVATLAALALPLGMSLCKGSTETKVPTSMAISPRTPSLTSIGATQQFSAVVKDQNGNALSGAKVTWSSSATAVVKIDTTGLATALTNGTASIKATSGAAADSTTTTVAQAAAGLTKSGGDTQTDSVLGQLPTPLQALVTDALGHAVAGQTVNFTTTSGGSLSTAAVTDATGHTQSTWTLGSSTGQQSAQATLAGSAVAPVTFTATATAGAPVAISKQAGDNDTTGTGQPVAVPPAVLVKDAHGNPAAGAQVKFAVVTGGGTVTGATAVSNASGIATVLTWTLGAAGSNTLSATLTGPATSVTFTATALAAGAPANAVALVGNNQIGLVGYGVNVRPAVKVTDVHGVPVSGVGVTFAVTGGGGSLTGGSATTNAFGIAQVAKWTLGASAGVNALTATVTGIAGNPVAFADTGYAEGYQITIVPYGAGLANYPAAQTAFDSAVARWQRMVYRPLQAVSLGNIIAGACDKGTPALSGTSTGLTIFASVDTIDGPGKILAEAGPCAIGPGGLTVVGVMKFDSADIGGLISNGSLSAVVLHEMSHVLGFGTIWGPPQPLYGIVANCLLDTSSAASPQDTYFGCPDAQAEFDSIGGTSYTGASLTPPGGNIVPVENCGQSTLNLIGTSACGSGTINSHWRLPVFGNELMVGYLPTNPKLSVVTVATMEDLGYTVNFDAADTYTHTFTAPAAVGETRIYVGNDIRSGPLFIVDAAGHLTQVRR